jgi:TatD DNase family protein
VLFDSHCHLTDPAFDDDRANVLVRAREAGVRGLVTIASGPADTEAGIELARTAGEEHPRVWTTAGIHPHRADSADAGGWARVRELVGGDEVVAVGECGLDYHYDNAPRPTQRRVFDDHLGLAAETGLPVVVHARSCDADMIAALRGAPEGVRGVVHCFTGSDELLETALEAGFHISFTGIVTFGSWSADHQIRTVPRERLMVETDAPYLSPAPHRGARNEPARVAEVAARVARVRGEEPDELGRRCAETTCRFYDVAL